METKYAGKIVKVYSYGFSVQTDSGEIGTLKKEEIPEDKLSDLSMGDRVVVIDRGRRSVKGRILWDWNNDHRFTAEDSRANSNRKSDGEKEVIEVPDTNILSALFKGKDRECATIILNGLLDNMQFIDSKGSYELACSLIEINRSYKPLLIRELTHRLYLKANKDFKIKMWMDRLIRYCNLQEVLTLYRAKDPIMVEWLDSEFDFLNIIDYPNLTAPIVLTENIEETLIQRIESASSSIQVAVAWFTNPKLLKPLIKSTQRGCEVTLITNNDLINNGGYCLRLDDLIDAGGSIHLVEYPDMVNHKFAIFDKKCVITGSYNWTIYAEYINRENVVLIEGEGMEATISAYVSIFNKLIEDFEKVEKMPDSVPEKPQYDRSSFKHYITEEVLFLARRTRSQEKRTSFYQTAVRLSPNHPHIPAEFKSSAEAQNVARRSAVRAEANRLREEEVSISEQLRQTNIQIAELRNQAQTITASNPQSSEVTALNEQIQDLSRSVDDNQQSIAILKAEQQLLQSVSDSQLQGSNGQFRIHLEWRTIDDLDLHLIIPDGQEIFYSKKEVISNGYKGHLDVDANAGSYTDTPQENIFWDNGAPEGRYKVNVHCYTYRSNLSSIPFVVTVFSEGTEPITRTGNYSITQAKEKQTKTVIEFEFTRANGIRILS